MDKIAQPIPTKPGPTKAQRTALAVALACVLAKPAEGLYLKTYYDPVGILTACYGTTGAEIRKGATYTLAQCEQFLAGDMMAAVNQVDKCVPGLPVPVLAAFADAVYNAGPKIACDTKNSTAARYLLAGKLYEACHQLPRWDKARVLGVLTVLPGLSKRRRAERDLCLQGAPA